MSSIFHNSIKTLIKESYILSIFFSSWPLLTPEWVVGALQGPIWEFGGGWYLCKGTLVLHWGFFSYYQNTFNVFSTLGLEPRTLHFSSPPQPELLQPLTL